MAKKKPNRKADSIQRRYVVQWAQRRARKTVNVIALSFLEDLIAFMRTTPKRTKARRGGL